MMEPNERVQYLANLVIVARIDGVVHPSEDESIEGIRQEIKATKTDLKRAQKSAETDNSQVELVGRFSDHIKNIEDMIFVSLADGNIARPEKELIVATAKKLGLQQHHIDRILSEAKARHAHLPVSGTAKCCPACKTAVTPSAKFCPSCGGPVADSNAATPIRTDLSIPASGITIAFAESSGAAFPQALELARKNPGFQEALRGGKRWYAATWSPSEIQGAVKLMEHMKGWRNRQVYVDGELREWDDVFGFSYCYRMREQAYNPNTYCFFGDRNELSIFGCVQCEKVWTEWADWFSFGRFASKSAFQFDKDRIRHEVLQDLHPCRFCPHLRLDFVEAVVDVFPETVNVTDRGPWGYKESYQQTPDAIAVKVRHEWGTETVYVDGVKPVGFSEAKRIIAAASRACGLPPVQLGL